MRQPRIVLNRLAAQPVHLDMIYGSVVDIGYVLVAEFASGASVIEVLF